MYVCTHACACCCTLKVRAVDLDTGSNGNVTYSLVKSNDLQAVERFTIERYTGAVAITDDDRLTSTRRGRAPAEHS